MALDQKITVCLISCHLLFAMSILNQLIRKPIYPPRHTYPKGPLKEYYTVLYTWLPRSVATSYHSCWAQRLETQWLCLDLHCSSDHEVL